MENLHIVFDGPPGPVTGRFVEVENDAGASIRVGEWKQIGELWHLVIPMGGVTDISRLTIQRDLVIGEVDRLEGELRRVRFSSEEGAKHKNSMHDEITRLEADVRRLHDVATECRARLLKAEVVFKLYADGDLKGFCDALDAWRAGH